MPSISRSLAPHPSWQMLGSRWICFRNGERRDDRNGKPMMDIGWPENPAGVITLAHGSVSAAVGSGRPSCPATCTTRWCGPSVSSRRTGALVAEELVLAAGHPDDLFSGALPALDEPLACTLLAGSGVDVSAVPEGVLDAGGGTVF
ncbi:hypothetical protein AB6N23_07135 [Cellulomonas sp. 179-A 9B4 NHS]|uniref:hypothetical protein n=1 Tax=Cellulomonas sp. 179-A 9B4 NHS TaxID=3142379 RepID=UPI00399FA7DF